MSDAAGQLNSAFCAIQAPLVFGLLVRSPMRSAVSSRPRGRPGLADRLARFQVADESAINEATLKVSKG